MSTPQLEDGFVRIANELLEAILGGGFSLHEQSVLFTIIRKTYGFGKKEDDVSASQIGSMCGVARQHVSSALNALAARNIITKRQGRYGMIVGIQKDHRLWIAKGQPKTSAASPESGLVQNPDTPIFASDVVQIPDTPSPDSGQVDSPESGHTKENLPKENHQKKRSCASAEKNDLNDETPAGQQGRAMTGATSTTDRFERFYAAYPRKRSRGVAEKEFKLLDPDDAMVDVMIAVVVRMVASGEWADPQFIPYPANWLSAKGWLDDATPAAALIAPLVPLPGESDDAFRRRSRDAIVRGGQVAQRAPGTSHAAPHQDGEDLSAEQRRERLAKLKRETGIKTASEVLQAFERRAT